MLSWWLIQLVAGAIMFTLLRYQRWSVRRSNQLAKTRLVEGFGLSHPGQQRGGGDP